MFVRLLSSQELVILDKIEKPKDHHPAIFPSVHCLRLQEYCILAFIFQLFDLYLPNGFDAKRIQRTCSNDHRQIPSDAKLYQHKSKFTLSNLLTRGVAQQLR